MNEKSINIVPLILLASVNMQVLLVAFLAFAPSFTTALSVAGVDKRRKKISFSVKEL